MNDDIEDYFNGALNEYASVPGYTAPAAPVAAPRPPTQNFAPPLPRTGPMVTYLSGLADFDIAARCSLLALARVVWLFYTKLAEGQTQGALAVLSLYGALWNLKRDVIAPGFVGHGQEHLPGVLSAAEWSTPMRQSMAFVLAGVTGFHTDIAGVLARMPANLGEVAGWFPSMRNVLPATDLAPLRAYIEAPMPTAGDPMVYLATFVRDDIRQCSGVARTTTPPSPTASTSTLPSNPQTPAHGGTPGAGSGAGIVPVPVVPDGGGGGASSSSSGASGLAMLVVLALVLGGGYLAWKDSQPKAPALGGGPGADEEEAAA